MVKRLLRTASVLALAVGGGEAWAQGDPSPGNPAPAEQATSQSVIPAPQTVADAEPSTGLGDIVVTAQRREESLQSVPIAVTAVTGDTLISRGVTDVSQLAKFVPGFNFGRTGSDARPAMRGIRTANNEVNGDPVIGYYIDGIYQSRTSQAILGFVDVARVEVQRGPQGTLYGRNTIGGNITVTTNEPTNEVDFGGTLTVGNYRRARFEGFVNTPLTDTLAFRVAGAFENQNGYVKNDYNRSADLFDVRQRFVRGSLKFEPTEQFTAVLRAEYSFNGGVGDSAFGYKQIGTYIDTGTCQPFFNATLVPINSRANNLDGIADCTTTAATPTRAAGVGVDLGIPIYRPGEKYRVDNDYRTFRRLKQFATSLDMSYDLGAFALRSITGYVDFTGNRTSDSDFSASTIAIDLQNTTTETFSQELQVLSNPGGQIDYVAGLFYYRDRLGSLFINQQQPAIVRSTAGPAVARAQGNGTYNYNRTKLESKAAYAQVTFHATDALSLTGGARYTSDRKQFFNASANGILPLPVAGQPNPLTLITLATPLVPDSVYGVRPSNCGGSVTATINIDAAGRYVGANYCPRTFNELTYRAAADYQITPANLLYASVSSGFRSGGFNAGQLQAQSAPTFEPETVTAFEVGSKNRLFGNTLQFNLSAFYNRYKDLQEPRPVIIGGTVISTIFNAATARAYGLEAETIWQPTSELTIGANISYLNAKYSRFENVPLPYGASILVNDAAATAPTIVNGVTIAAAGQRRVFAPGYSCAPIAGTGGTGQPALTFGCDLTGNNIPHSPRYSGSAYAGYDIDLGASGTLTPFAAITYSGRYDEQSFNDRAGVSPAYVKLDLNLTWKYNPQITVEAYGTNVTNETVRTIVSYGGTPLQASYEPPAQYGLRLIFRR